MFSTMINFGMLGLLRRLHRLQIQAKLQAESNATGIVYPRAKKHKIKDGDGTYITPFLSDIKDTNIAEVVKRAEIRAKASLEKLGMATLLQVHKVWDSLYAYDCDDTEIEDDSDEEGDSENIPVDKTLVSASVKEVCTEDSSAIEKFFQKVLFVPV